LETGQVDQNCERSKTMEGKTGTEGRALASAGQSSRNTGRADTSTKGVRKDCETKAGTFEGGESRDAVQETKTREKTMGRTPNFSVPG